MGIKYRAVIFDCDGTLIDTIEDIAMAMNDALQTHGYPTLPTSEYFSRVGWGIYKLAALVLPEEERTDENIEKLGKHAGRFMEELPMEKNLSKPYPGIKPLLGQLKERKIKIAVLSNKLDSVLQRIMVDFFSPLTFDAVYGLRPGLAPKPDPAAVWEMLAEMGYPPHQTIFVGDSEIDIETAKNSGCYPLGVSWGFRTKETLVKAGAAGIIDDPQEIWDLIGRK